MRYLENIHTTNKEEGEEKEEEGEERKLGDGVGRTTVLTGLQNRLNTFLRWTLSWNIIWGIHQMRLICGHCRDQQDASEKSK